MGEEETHDCFEIIIKKVTVACRCHHCWTRPGAFVPVPFFNIGKEACKFMIVAVIAITNIFVIDGSAAVHSLTLQRSTLNGDVHHPSGQMNNNS